VELAAGLSRKRATLLNNSRGTAPAVILVTIERAKRRQRGAHVGDGPYPGAPIESDADFFAKLESSINSP
jgi:hypothetical protein